MNTVRVRGTRTKTMPLTTVSLTIFLYLNLKQKNIFANNVGHIWFHDSEYNFWKNFFFRKLQFRTILLPLKKCVTEKRTYVNKEYKLLNSYLLTILLSIFFNELPGGGVAIALPAGKFLLYNSYQCLATSNMTSG